MGGDSRIPPTPPGHVPDPSAGASKAQTNHVVVQCGTADGIASNVSREEIQSDLKERLKQTATWSTWAPGLLAALKVVIPKFRDGQAQQPMLSKLDLAGWKRHLQAQHVPYRRDCKVCLETMGSAEPHRRKKGQESAFVMSVDIYVVLSIRAPIWVSPSAEK